MSYKKSLEMKIIRTKYEVYFCKEVQASAVIRGLRNGADLQYETNMQYWNEDLGLEIPVVYFICDRKLSHISSSMIRELNKLGLQDKLNMLNYDCGL